MYCSPEDVKGEIYLPLLSQMTAKFGDGTDNFLSTHIERADDYVNAVLSQSFEVPFASTPAVVATISAKLAAYYATARFSEQEELSEDKKDAAVDMLKALVKSRRLPGETATAIEDASDRITGGSSPQIFTEAYMADW